MKKIVSIVLILCCFTCFNVHAKDDVMKSSNCYSEYDSLVKLEALTLDKMHVKGCADDDMREISVLKETIISELKKIKRQDIDKLKSDGYSNQQINCIKNISDDDLNSYSRISQMPRAFFGSLDSNFWQIDHKTFRYEWEWTSKPVVKSKDGIGFAWDAGIRVASWQIDAEVSYKGGNNAGTKGVKREDIEIFPGAGWGHSFNMTSGHASSAPAWAYKGKGEFECTNPSSASSVHMIMKYGHAVINITGLGLDCSATPSIGFGFGVDHLGKMDKIFDLTL